MYFILSLLVLVSASDLKVASQSIKNGQTISNSYVFNSFGCSGENKSPQVSWQKGPTGTKFYAVTIYDPDAPTGSGWWHWLVVNIPSTVLELPEGASKNSQLLPAGSLETRTDFGSPGYGGPCPPAGDKAHRYYIKVFALKEKINVEKDSSGAMVGYSINANKIAEGQVMGRYSRK